eukprot:g33073.t1
MPDFCESQAKENDGPRRCSWSKTQNLCRLVVLTNIFNLSLLQAEVPTRFKKTAIFPAMAHINSSLPTCLDSLQFAYQQNRSTEDAISLALHSSLEHLDNKDIYIRLHFVDYSSTINTINPSRMISKFCDLGLSSTLCNWILSFLTHKPQSVRI